MTVTEQSALAGMRASVHRLLETVRELVLIADEDQPRDCHVHLITLVRDAALDIAADYKRDRAAACADCADQTCVTCRSRLRDAQAYDQVAAQMLQTAEAARAVNAGQPEPGAPPVPPRQPQPAADKEAGQ